MANKQNPSSKSSIPNEPAFNSSNMQSTGSSSNVDSNIGLGGSAFRSDNLDMDSDSGENITNISDEMRNRQRPSSTSSSSSNMESEGSDQFNQMREDFTRRATEVYGEASQWIRQNQNTVYIAMGALAAVGFLGYFLSRRMRTEEYRSSDLDAYNARRAV